MNSRMYTSVLLLGLALATAQAASSIKLSSATMNLTSTTLTLTFNSSVSALIASANWSTSQLQEGFFSAAALSVMSIATSGNSTVILTLNPSVHRTVEYPLAYTLTYTSQMLSGLISGNITIYPSTNYTYSFAPTDSTPLSCPLLGGQVYQAYRVQTKAQLMEIGARRCAYLPGALEIVNLSLSEWEWYAGLGTLQSLDGYLLLSNNTGLNLRHFARLQEIAAGQPALLYNGNGLSVEQPLDGTSLGGLPAFVDLVVAGTARLVLGASCPSAAQLTPRWWADPDRLYVEHSLAACSNACFMFTNNASGVCASYYQGTPRTCNGNIIRDATFVTPYVGRSCVYISGSLSFTDMASIPESLLEAFASVTYIDGALTISDNNYLIGLDFLRNVKTASFVSITGNPSLVDARLPKLNTSIAVTIKQNNHICATAGVSGTYACGSVGLAASFSVCSNSSGFAVSANAIASAAVQAFGLNASLTSVALSLLSPSCVMANLTSIVSANQSWSKLFAIQSASLQLSLNAIVNNNATVAMLADPSRSISTNFSFDLGIKLTSQPWTVDAVPLSWTPLGVATNSTPVYSLQYTIMPSAGVTGSISDLFGGSYYIDSSIVNDAFVALVDWISVPISGSFSYPLVNCLRLGAVTAQSRCLSPAYTYRVRVQANVELDTYYSNELQLSVPNIAMAVQNLTAVADPSNPAITVSWELPQLPSGLNNITLSGYVVQLFLADNGNALTAPNTDASFTHELLSLGGQRVRLAANVTMTTFSGCFLDSVTGSTQCLRPWTTYLVTIWTTASLLTGLPISLRVTTSAAVSDLPARFPTADVVSSTSASFFIFAPEILTGPLTAFRVTAIDSRGGQYTALGPVTLPDNIQAISLDNPYNVFLSGLPSYTDFTATFAAITAMGVGPESEVITFSTQEGVPLKMPPPLVVRNHSTGELDVTWAEPFPLPGEIIYYELYRDCGSNSTNNNSGVVYTGPLDTVSLPFICDGIRVTAATSAGEGDYSELGTESQDSSSSSSSVSFTIISAAGGCGLAVLVVVAMIVRRMRRHVNLTDKFDPGPVDRFEFNRTNLKLGRELGRGAFGIVCEGVAYKIQEFPGPLRVAVKQCNNESLRTSDKDEFMGEANLMKKFCGTNWHRNVVRLLGVCTREEPLMIITEILDRGDLKEFLRKMRPAPNAKPRMSLAHLILLMEDVANGMAFLANAGFVHRDLACRNCLVSADMTVKISDFGLARFLDNRDYYRKRNGEALLPVRWMAPESLQRGVFDTTTDVWSMGVVMWEILTFASLPYPGMNNQDVYEKCWKASTQRPSFAELAERLHDVQNRVEQGRLDDDLVCAVGTTSALFDYSTDADSGRSSNTAGTVISMSSQGSKSSYLPLSPAPSSAHPPRVTPFANNAQPKAVDDYRRMPAVEEGQEPGKDDTCKGYDQIPMPSYLPMSTPQPPASPYVLLNGQPEYMPRSQVRQASAMTFVAPPPVNKVPQEVPEYISLRDQRDATVHSVVTLYASQPQANAPQGVLLKKPPPMFPAAEMQQRARTSDDANAGVSVVSARDALAAKLGAALPRPQPGSEYVPLSQQPRSPQKEYAPVTY